MNRQQMEELLAKQVIGLNDFTNGYKSCAKFVLDELAKLEGPKNSGIQANTGNTEQPQ